MIELYRYWIKSFNMQILLLKLPEIENDGPKLSKEQSRINSGLKF